MSKKKLFTFSDALAELKSDSGKTNLKKLVDKLVGQMTQKEKFYMLSGHTIWITQKNMIKTGRNYNVEGLPMGGCKRLGIPPAKFSDGPRGVVMGNSTCFPVSVLRAATFDTQLEYRVGKAIAKEILAQGANYFAGICINLVRNPRWGRSQESYSEDPFVLGEFGAALTRSVQEEGVIACPKHFAMNSIEDLRFFVNVEANERALREVYLPHFKKCVDAGALSMMGAYNRFHGEWCCENTRLLTDILRNEWGFDGFTISDFVNGVRNAERSIRAGMDIEMMFTMKYMSLPKLYKKGLINEKQIDKSVGNIIGVLLRTEPLKKQYGKNIVASKEHYELAREVAEKGMVLLKNNGVLPISKDKKIAIVGNYADKANTGDHGSSRVHSPRVITVAQGFESVYKSVAKHNGTDIRKALKASEGCDTVIVTAGNDRTTEGEFFAIGIKYKANQKPKNKGGDRESLRLSESEISLIKALKKAGKKVVVAIFSGGAVICNDFIDDADAVFMNFYSGSEGGTAMSRLVCGDVNFSGKLPFTVAQNESDYPKFIGLGDKPYEIEYGYYHGYTLLDKENKQPEFPFGYGLSYTIFDCKNLEVTDNDDSVSVQVDVANTGKTDGAEVVQVYFGSNGADDDRPIKLLKGFERVELKAGESKRATITVPKEELKFYDDKTNTWLLDKAYTVYVGGDSQRATALSQKIEF